jgi:hypothetical protein
MTFFDTEQRRVHQFIEEAKDQLGARIVKAILITGFYLFSPYVIVINLMTFYALYQGIGYWITLVVLSILLSLTLLMLDYQLTKQVSTQPQSLWLAYYVVSVVVIIPGIVWGIV